MSLYLAAALQNGPDITDSNTCKIVKRFRLADPNQCAQWIDSVALVIVAIIFTLCIATLVWELCAWRKWKAKMGPALVVGGIALTIFGGLIWFFEFSKRSPEVARSASGPVAQAQVEKTPSTEKPPLAESPPRLEQAQSKPAFDLGGNTDIAVGKAQLCGEMTIIKTQPGSGGSFSLGDFTGIAPGAKCTFPPPTEAMKSLSNKDLKQQIATLCAVLDEFQQKIDNQLDFRLNSQQRRELSQKATDEFKSSYLVQAMALNNAVAARVGWIDIPDSKPNEANVIKAEMWSTLTRNGRATLSFAKPIGNAPAKGVSNYLTFIAEKLP